jgi:hypothetical protein
MLRAANIGEACHLFGSQRHFGTTGVSVACPAALKIKAMVLWLSRYRILPANVIERKRFATRRDGCAHLSGQLVISAVALDPRGTENGDARLNKMQHSKTANEIAHHANESDELTNP